MKLFTKWKKNSKNIYIYMVSELANAYNSHNSGGFGSDQGSVTGYTVVGNKNIDRSAPAKAATAGVGQKGGKRRRRGGRRKRRGGGYGFNPNGKPQFGRPPIKVTNNCGVSKDPDLGSSTQFVGSPPPQRGGSGYGSSALRGTDLDDQEARPPTATVNYGAAAPNQKTAPSSHVPGQPQKGGARGGACGGCGGTPYYGYTAADPSLTNYAPVTAECHAQCGGARRTRRRGRRRARRKTRRRARRRTRRRVRRRRRRQRGGYYQFGSNTPSTPGYATPNGGNWQTANPPTYARNDACGTGNCVDNYNHFTGKGFASPVLDGDVHPPPAPPVIKTPNNTTQCGGRRRRKGGRRKSRRRGGNPIRGWIQNYETHGGGVTLFIVRGERPEDPENAEHSDEVVLYTAGGHGGGKLGQKYWTKQAKKYAAVMFEELHDDEVPPNAYTNHLDLAPKKGGRRKTRRRRR